MDDAKQIFEEMEIAERIKRTQIQDTIRRYPNNYQKEQKIELFTQQQHILKSRLLSGKQNNYPRSNEMPFVSPEKMNRSQPNKPTYMNHRGIILIKNEPPFVNTPTAHSSPYEEPRRRMEGPTSRLVTPQMEQNSYQSQRCVSRLPKECPGKECPGRSRLFVGGLPPSTKSEEIQQIFGKFGTVHECTPDQKNVGFIIRLNSREIAYKAIQEMDGAYHLGKRLIVRFSPHPAAIWINYLPNGCCNELLYQAFLQFGKIERAVVVCGGNGESLGYGIVEFVHASSAQTALQECSKKPFCLGRTPKPVKISLLNHKEEDIGLPSKNVNHEKYEEEFKISPRFLDQNSKNKPHHEIGVKWQHLYNDEARAKEALKHEFDERRQVLIAEQTKLLAHEDKEKRRWEQQQRKQEILHQQEIFERQHRLHQEMQQRQWQQHPQWIQSPYVHHRQQTQHLPLNPHQQHPLLQHTMHQPVSLPQVRMQQVTPPPGQSASQNPLIHQQMVRRIPQSAMRHHASHQRHSSLPPPPHILQQRQHVAQHVAQHSPPQILHSSSHYINHPSHHPRVQHSPNPDAIIGNQLHPSGYFESRSYVYEPNQSVAYKPNQPGGYEPNQPVGYIQPSISH